MTAVRTALAPAAALASRHPLALIGAGVVLYATGPVMLQSSTLSGPAFSFWRLWIGAVFLGGLALARRGGGVAWRGPAGRWTAMAGVAFGVHQLMFMTAVKLTSVVDVALMNALAPIATAVGAWWLFRERPGVRFVAWSGVAIAGGAYLAVAAVGPAGDPFGILLAIGNVVCFAGFFLASKQSREHLPVLPFLAGVMLVAASIVTAFTLVAGVDVAPNGPSDLVLAAGVAIGPGALGHFVMTWPLRWVPANIPPVMRLAQPAIAGLLAFLILGEPMGAHHVLGGAVVIAAAAAAVLSRDGRALRQQAQADAAPLPRPAVAG